MSWVKFRPLLLLMMFIGFCIVYFSPQIINHFTFAPGDDMIQNLPLRALVGSELRDGALPLWDPYLWTGIPLLAGMNAGAAYPMTWIFSFLPVLMAWKINVVGTYVISLLLTYGYARKIGISWFGSIIAAICFSLGGFMIDQMAHIGDVMGATWIPGILWAIEWAFEGKTISIFYLAIFLGLMINAGSPEPIVYGLIFVSLYAFVGIYKLPRSQRSIATQLIIYGYLLGLGIGAMQLIPAYQFVDLSQRANPSFKFFSGFSLPVSNLPLFWIPYLWGSDMATKLAPVHFFGKSGTLAGFYAYVGLGAVAAFFGSIWNSKQWRTKFWIVTTVIGVLMALGPATPLDHLLYHVPIYKGLRVQTRNVLEVNLALSILAGSWLGSLKKISASSFVVGLCCGPFVPLLFTALLVIDPQWVQNLVLHIFPGAPVSQALSLTNPEIFVPCIVSAIWIVILILARKNSPKPWIGILLIGVCFLDLFVNGQQDMWTVSPPYHGPAFVSSIPTTNARELQYYPQQLAPFPNATDKNILYGTPSVQGYGSLLPARYQSITQSHILGTFNPLLISKGSNFLAALDLRYMYLSQSEVRDLNFEKLKGWRVIKKVGTNVILRSNAPIFYAWYIPQIKKVNSYNVNEMISLGNNFNHIGYVKTARNILKSPAGNRGTVRVVKNAPGFFQATVHATGRGAIVISQEYFPGWKAKVNNNPTRVFPVDGLLQGVMVPKGRSIVTLFFLPRTYILALGLSVLSTLISCMILVISVRRARGVVISAEGRISHN